MKFLFTLPRSIYSRTMLLVGVVMFVLQVITFSIFFQQMVLPNVQIHVGHFVDALEAISHNPAHLQSINLMSGSPLIEEIGEFEVAPADLQLGPSGWRIPFWHFVDDELEQRFGRTIPMYREQGVPRGEGNYWIDLPLRSGAPLRVGFSEARKGCLNPQVLLLVLLLVTAFSVTSVYFLSRWLVQPIEELQTAVGEMGRGAYPKPLPEKGPSEFSVLVQRFNWMVQSVQSLTDNRSTLLAGISHDLKTPLARMRLSMEMLSREQDRELVEGMVDDLDVMDHLINQALAFARGESQGKQEEIDLNVLISAMVERKKRGGVEIEWRSPPEPCLQIIDSAALIRVLSNYIDNAHRYGGEQPIEVVLVCTEEHIEVEVVNYGEGIERSELERLFEPFYRVDSSRSEERGGSGLGLAIVKNLAIINGWQVSLNNHPEGGVVAKVVLA